MSTKSTNRRKLAPPREKAARQRYFGLIGKAKTAPPAQKQALLQLARGLMVWVEVDGPARP